MFKGIILVLLGACSFGILSTFVKLAYHDGFHLGDVVGSQAFFGMVILWILYFFQTQTKTFKEKAVKTTTAWWKLVLTGTSTGLVSILYYQCVKLVPASIAIILLMQFTWISMLLELVLFKKKPSGIQMLAVLLVLGGTVFASGMIGNKVADIDLVGVLFGLLAALSYAIFMMINGRVGTEYPPLKKSALMVTGSCILIFIIFGPSFLFDGSLMRGLLKWGLLLAIFGTVIPPVFFASGIPKAGLALSSILSAIELPVAVTMSHFVLHESVTSLRWIGILIIIMALILPNLKHLKKSAPIETAPAS